VNGDDVVSIAGSAPNAHVNGLAARVSVTGGIAGSDRLTVNGLTGDDLLDASTTTAGSTGLTLAGGPGDDVLLGGDGTDTLLGGDGDDLPLGGPGADTIDGGNGDNIIIQNPGADAVSPTSLERTAWLKSHTHATNGKTVLKIN
jgi:Ca2+-binding RTX toxin-like protein